MTIRKGKKTKMLKSGHVSLFIKALTIAIHLMQSSSNGIKFKMVKKGNV